MIKSWSFFIQVVRAIVVSVASDVFKEDVNWARIISLLAVAAGLASDCVKQGALSFFIFLHNICSISGFVYLKNYQLVLEHC